MTSSLDDLTDKNLFAYCDNNPIVRRDSSGYVWETVLDIASLAVSVGEVVMKPTDPWAWAGLAGDTIDLLPFVTGVGEVTRAVKVANNIDNVTDTAKAVKKVDYYVTPLGDAIPATRKGFYNNLSKLENKNGKYYGKDLGGPVRIRVEKHDPKPGYKGPYNPYHTSLHFHIDRKVNGKTGQYKKGFTGLMRWLR